WPVLGKSRHGLSVLFDGTAQHDRIFCGLLIVVATTSDGCEADPLVECACRLVRGPHFEKDLAYAAACCASQDFVYELRTNAEPAPGACDSDVAEFALVEDAPERGVPDDAPVCLCRNHLGI